ncbi:MAG: hypothetical protein ACYSWO_20390 [Planctomycetota bacterium]|jgi:hypothetical protein
MSKKLLCLALFVMVVMAAPAGADTLSGLADVTIADGAIVSLRHADTEYVVADGDLVLGTTTRWYVDSGVETLWAEGDPAPADTVSGTSNAKEGDVGSKADNFNITLDGATNISSIDGIDFQETIFPAPTDTIFLFERGGNDKGTWQAILEDGSLGAEVAFDKASNGGPYADTGDKSSGQGTYGVVFTTDVPAIGVRITASGHDTLSISTPKGADTAAPDQRTITIVNPGFEDPVLDPDGWTWIDVPGWTSVGGEAPGVWHVTSADFDPVVAPEGQNVLYTENAVGDGAAVAQVLTETFAADTNYTLTVEVGNSNYYYNGGYSVQLLAGGIVIAEDNDTLWPDYKTWATSTVAYTYDPADSGLVGQPLEIRLINLGLDKDSPPDNTVGVEFDDVRLSADAGAAAGVTIPVDPTSDLAAANELAQPGDTIEFAEGMYLITSQILIKDGVTYKGAGPGLTIIDGNDVTRAFVAWGDRSVGNGQVDANGITVPNNTGPKGWVLEGMTVQNCVADTANRYDILSAARDLLNNYADVPYTLETAQAENGGVTNNPEWFEILSGAADDDLTDVELQAYLDGNPVGSAGHLVANNDKNGDGGAIDISNSSVGTIENCDFLSNHTPIAGDGDDGGAISVGGRSTVTINDCWFDGNYACSPTSVAESDDTGDADGDGGHIKVQGNNLAGGFIEVGTTLIVNRCTFLNGNAEDDGGAIQATADGLVVRLDSCWFEGNTAWDNGNVLQFPDEDQHEVTVTNCVFANNVTKSDNSPDRMIETRRNSKFINCTFVGNIQEDQDLIYNNADAADGDDDGTDDEMSDVAQVINCLFVNNVVGNGDDVLGSRNGDFTIAAINCLFFGNTLQNGNPADNTQRPDEEAGTIDVSAVTDAAQILVDPVGDYHPAAGSPAIDASDPATATEGDIEGTPAVGVRDVGAYEAN